MRDPRWRNRRNSQPPRPQREPVVGDGRGERLQKVLARIGLASRRQLEDWISAGRVTVNGVTASLGQRIGIRDRVCVDGRLVEIALEQAGPDRVLVYHKPAGEIVSRDDPQGRPSVYEGLPRLRSGRWIAVGRLDFNTSGLLLFTNSGDLANRLMHPSHEVEREYAVRVRGELSAELIERLVQGVRLDDGIARFERVEPRGGMGSNRWYHVVLMEGRNREVRRMFGALGLTVSRLIRVRFGSLTLPPRLRRGCYLELGPREMRLLEIDASGSVSTRAADTRTVVEPHFVEKTFPVARKRR